jgi:hypothetical protein
VPAGKAAVIWLKLGMDGSFGLMRKLYHFYANKKRGCLRKKEKSAILISNELCESRKTG